MDVQINLVDRRDLSGEVYRQLRRAILTRQLAPGMALPSSRHLAQRLSVARATITVAYDRLIGEGFAETRTGAGTFVSAQLKGVRQEQTTRRVESALRAQPVWDSVRLSTAFDQPAKFDFRTGIVDASLFPHERWRRLMAKSMRTDARASGVYGHPAGSRSLREAIARHIGIARAVQVSAEDLTITNGTQQALDIIARVLLARGDRVAVEDPGYSPPRMLFRAHGLQVVGVPVDSEGLVVDALPRGVRLVYVTPSHQYPLGMPMTLRRRFALLAWAERHDAAIVEDDYDSEFRFGGRPIEPIQTLDTAGRVIYIGSFSKSLLPTLRLGFVVTPPSLRTSVHKVKYLTDWHTSTPLQATLARFIEEGWFARHVRRAQAIYRERHALVTQALIHDLRRHLELIPSNGGLHVAALARRLSHTQVQEVVRAASDVGVGIHPLSRFAAGQAAASGLLFGYGSIAAARIGEGLDLLKRCFDKTLPKRRS